MGLDCADLESCYASFVDVEIDKLHLLALVGDDKQAVAEILDDFLGGGLSLLDEMELALSKADIDSFEGTLHQLKGASSMFGLKSVCQICVGLEAESFEGIEVSTLLELRDIFGKSYKLAKLLVVG
ncbi:MAG: Hpt domain-containing protein [Rubritalea sp.]|uniref:Hpt domain-containing protein n=1 Tax=Rubritalea sp. TaxID=2109375 RepID=UPI00324221FC